MKVKMKVLDYSSLVRLNESSVRTGRKQNLMPDQMPDDRDRQFIVNFRFEHEWEGQRDARLSVILQPGVRTVWLDVSLEEYDGLPEEELSEFEWEAAVCVGTPRWTA